MKKKLIALFCVGLLAAGSQVFGASALGKGQFYVSARGGAMTVDRVTTAAGTKVTLDTGYAITGAVGYVMPIYDLGNPYRPLKLRLEIESGYAEASKSGYKVKIVPVMFNAMLEYNLTEKIYVFGGVGGGLSIQKSTGEDDHNYYAVQARGGVGYMFNEVLSLELSYRLYAQQFKSPLAQMFEGGITMRF